MTDREALLTVLLEEAITVPCGEYPLEAWFSRWWAAWRARVAQEVQVDWSKYE